MEFGWDIPNVHHGFGLDAYAFGGKYDEGVAVGVETFRRVAPRVEEIGFNAIWVADHVLFPDKSEASHPLGYRANTGRSDDNASDGHNVRSGDPSFEAITTMSYLAGLTKKVRIGVGVLVIPYRNPVLVAKMLASLDVLSDGRIIVATGVGWLKEAFEALRADYEHRGAVTDEYIDIMRTIWREPSPVYQGQFYDVPAGLQFNPKPVQKEIPIWIGGVSKPALRRAGRRGTGWLGVYQPLDTTREMHATIRGHLERNERSVDDFTFAHRVRFQVTDLDGGDQPCIGTPQKIADGVRRYHEVGVRHLQFAPPPGPTTAYLLEQADRFEHEVKPLIEDLWG